MAAKMSVKILTPKEQEKFAKAFDDVKTEQEKEFVPSEFDLSKGTWVGEDKHNVATSSKQVVPVDRKAIEAVRYSFYEGPRFCQSAHGRGF